MYCFVVCLEVYFKNKLKLKQIATEIATDTTDTTDWPDTFLCRFPFFFCVFRKKWLMVEW